MQAIVCILALFIQFVRVNDISRRFPVNNCFVMQVLMPVFMRPTGIIFIFSMNKKIIDRMDAFLPLFLSIETFL
jgi:hypothetical protein